MAIKLMFPVGGPITQYFGENPDIYKKWGYAGHNGVDFGIPNGTPIIAAADGTVEKVGFEDGGYGNFVKIAHTDGGTPITPICKAHPFSLDKKSRQARSLV